MTKPMRWLALVLLAGQMNGCAYKPLKAPCGPDEDTQALAFAERLMRIWPKAVIALDRCGTMRPIGGDDGE